MRKPSGAWKKKKSTQKGKGKRGLIAEKNREGKKPASPKNFQGDQEAHKGKGKKEKRDGTSRERLLRAQGGEGRRS